MAYNGCLSVQRLKSPYEEFVRIGANVSDHSRAILSASAEMWMTPAQAVWLRDALNDLLTPEDAKAAAKAREDV